MRAVYDVGITIAAGGALFRVGAVVVGAVRSLRARKRFTEFRVGPIELLTWLEPPALATAAILLLVDRGGLRSPSTVEAAFAVVGGLIVAYGVNVLLWAVLSWRQLFVGHGVLEGHRIVDRGAYGFVRHPAYLAALLVWAGLSIAFLNPIAALVTALYVFPTYIAYLRSEEAMMEAHFGDEYRRYRERVPMLVPRIGGEAPHGKRVA
jgi:protein-S-isoprenylcysteine O-methyltransferase Ste14